MSFEDKFILDKSHSTARYQLAPRGFVFLTALFADDVGFP